MKKIEILLACILFAAVSAFSQETGLPPNPEPGKCYVRCITKDKWEARDTQVLVRAAYTRLEVVPAQYETVEERVLIKPATKKFVYIPAEFKTVEEEVFIEEPYNKVTLQEASFTREEAKVEVQPSFARFEYQPSLEDCESEDPRDCMVLCYVEYDPVVNTYSVQRLSNDASFNTTKTGGRTIKVTKQVLVSEARVEEIEIPAEYEAVTRRVLVQDETVREVTVPAEYKADSVKVLLEPGGLAVWESIDCGLVNFNILPIYYDLNSALLTDESKAIIDERLYALMKAKPLIRIEINSHTDSRATATFNMDLSNRRARAVVNYLVSKGIARDRLVAKGYGEARLVNDCSDGVPCSEAQHAKNRRTEFRVLTN